MTVFEYLILISARFCRILFLLFLPRLVSIGKIYQTLNTVYDYISKDLKICEKYAATRSRCLK